ASYLQNSSVSIELIPSSGGTANLDWLAGRLGEDVSAVVVQSPNRLGVIESWKEVGKLCSDHPTLFIAVGDPLAFGLLAPPGECGADVYAGEGQVLGSPVSFGGPYLGLLASRMEYVRKIPGRLVGATRDVEGRPGFVLALQTREQHIRRERATSNICTNQGLVALRAAIYLALMGRQGYKDVADLCFQKSHYAAREIARIPGYSLPFGETFFKEFVVTCPVPSETIVREGVNKGIFPGTPLKDDPRFLRIAVTENSTREDMDRLVAFLREFGP
ncbi:MAG: glycine dehydrogenase, partial [Fidelibacterota bacterium]